MKMFLTIHGATDFVNPGALDTYSVFKKGWSNLAIKVGANFPS